MLRFWVHGPGCPGRMAPRDWWRFKSTVSNAFLPYLTSGFCPFRPAGFRPFIRRVSGPDGSRSRVLGLRSAVVGLDMAVLGSRSRVLGLRSGFVGLDVAVLGSRSRVSGSDATRRRRRRRRRREEEEKGHGWRRRRRSKRGETLWRPGAGTRELKTKKFSQLSGGQGPGPES